MILLAKRLARQETDADKIEFVKGITGFTPEEGRKKAVKGFVAGYLLTTAALASKWRRQNTSS